MYLGLALICFLIVYPFAVYPLILLAVNIANHSKNLLRDTAYEPKISLVIPFHFPEAPLENKLREIFDLDYPEAKIEVILVSDGAALKTEGLLDKFPNKNIHIIELPVRQGKAIALNQGVSRASHEVVVFFDLRQSYDNKIIRELVGPLGNEKIGGVTGDIVYEGYAGANMYWQLESFIRKQEGYWKGTINVTGANYCLRKHLVNEFPKSIILDDLYQPLSLSAKGIKIVCNPGAKAYDKDYQSSKEIELEKKVRTLAGNFQILFEFPEFLNPLKNRAWFQYYSHKILRLTVPVFLLILYTYCFILFDESIIVLVLFIGQSLIYGLYLSKNFLPESFKSNSFISVPFLFIRLNSYVIRGFFSFLYNKNRHLW